MPDNNPSTGGESVQQQGGAYVKPVLKVYGPVAVVTSATDRKGNPDGGPNNSRT
jgi:hypothetical protein